MAQRTKAFTLIELLVVIAIIALLLSIVMPALKESKKRAQTVICRSNIKQWGLIFSLYAQDNGQSLPQSTGADWGGHDDLGPECVLDGSDSAILWGRKDTFLSFYKAGQGQRPYSL